MRKSAAGATCQHWAVHRPASGVACPLKGGSALTRAGWEYRVYGFGVQGLGLLWRAKPGAAVAVRPLTKGED